MWVYGQSVIVAFAAFVFLHSISVFAERVCNLVWPKYGDRYPVNESAATVDIYLLITCIFTGADRQLVAIGESTYMKRVKKFLNDSCIFNVQKTRTSYYSLKMFCPLTIALKISYLYLEPAAYINALRVIRVSLLRTLILGSTGLRTLFNCALCLKFTAVKEQILGNLNVQNLLIWALLSWKLQLPLLLMTRLLIYQTSIQIHPIARETVQISQGLFNSWR